MAVLLLQFAALLSLAFPAQGLPVTSKLDESDSQWDYFLFVQEHPPGVCFFQSEQKGCYYPPNVTTTTIHGLWPTRNNTQGPNYCDPSATFSLENIKSLLPRLVAEWTNLEPYTAFASFWSHEWLKHGTCASGVSCLSTEYGFFSTVLDLFGKMNYGEVLGNYGIKPSNSTTYKSDQFNSAFEDAYGVKPFLSCKYLKGFGQVLIQISLCLQKDFSPMQCGDDALNRSGACWDSEPIHYLASWY